MLKYPAGMNLTELLAIGGAHIDRTARMVEPHIMGASNPVSFNQTIGGGAFNAARVAKLRGIQNIAMMSLRGADAMGNDVEHEIVRQKMADYSGIFMDRTTPSYTAIIDTDGELVTALADMELYDYGFERQVRRKEGRQRIKDAASVLIDANLPESAVTRVCDKSNGTIFAMAISPAKVGRLISSASYIDTLFLNQRELGVLTTNSTTLAKLGFKRAVISDGSGAVIICEGEKTKPVKVPPAPVNIDVTGAGDALAGGTIAALIANPNRPINECVMEGIACAQLALQKAGPLCEATDVEQFSKILALVHAAQ